jgi:hypothetical protein
MIAESSGATAASQTGGYATKHHRSVRPRREHRSSSPGYRHGAAASPLIVEGVREHKREPRACPEGQDGRHRDVTVATCISRSSERSCYANNTVPALIQPSITRHVGLDGDCSLLGPIDRPAGRWSRTTDPGGLMSDRFRLSHQACFAFAALIPSFILKK